MKPTQSLQSGHGPNFPLGVKGHVTFSVSPFQQKVFVGFFQKLLPEFNRRMRKDGLVVGIPLVGFISLYKWMHKANEQYHHKLEWS